MATYSMHLRTHVAAARRRWRDTQPIHDARGYVFLDESGVTTDLLRRYGRSPRGARLRDHTRCGHWQTHTVIAALRIDGLHAPAVFDGPLDNATFVASVEQALVPTLRPGDVVILDNLVIHKHQDVPAALDRIGVRLRFLPPYSPDLNPIELAFGKPSPLHAPRMPQLCPALRLSCCYAVMKNARVLQAAPSPLETKSLGESLEL